MKKKNGILSIIFTILFGILLMTAAVLLILLVFVHALNGMVRLPSIGSVPGERISAFFDSWYPLVFGCAAVAVPLLLIVLINMRRIRRAFAAIGISAAVTAAVSAVSGYAGPSVIKELPGDWQDALINTTAVFKDFSAVCAVILIVLGAGCLSVYSCIAIVKGDEL